MKYLFLALLHFQLFATPVKVIELQKQKTQEGWTFEVGETPITSRTLEESTGYVKPKVQEVASKYQDIEPDKHLPKWFDWRWLADGLVPIKDQGHCGSCWAFGTVAVLESLVKIHTGKTESLSEQELVSCSDCGSCSGGNFCHSYHMKPGAATTSEFPYRAKNMRCKNDLAPQEKIVNWYYIQLRGGKESIAQIKTAIKRYGPVAVTVSANSAMQAYRGGVFNACSHGGTNHIVSLIGWDDSTGTWIMRNSWGVDWGNAGYMNIKYGCSSIGEEVTYAEYLQK